MANYHVIDPTFFYDAIDGFSFPYDWYVKNAPTLNNLGEPVITYTKKTIWGSLQSKGATITQSKDSGNQTQHKYEFYCKSLYRINIGDIINYKNKWMYVDSIVDIDEYGVRSATCTMTELSEFRDYKEAIKYLTGSEVI